MMAKEKSFYLTNIPKRYGWTSFGEYSFADLDEVYKDRSGKMSNRELRISKGYQRYEITFNRIPDGRKREVMNFMEFDDDGKYVRMWSSGKTVRKKQLKEWEKEAIEWLTSQYIIMERSGK